MQVQEGWQSAGEYSDENVSHNTSYNSAADLANASGPHEQEQLISFVYDHAGPLNAFHYSGGSGGESEAPQFMEEVEEEEPETATRFANQSISMSSLRDTSKDTSQQQ